MLSQKDQDQIHLTDDGYKRMEQHTLVKIESITKLPSNKIEDNSSEIFLTHEQKIQATYNFQYLFRKKSHLYKMNKKKKNPNKQILKNQNQKNADLDKQQKVSKKGHWSTEQNKKYYWFLQIYNKHFIHKHLRRTDRIFKTMSTFIGTREAEQCRSHHQKMQKKYRNFYQIIIKLRLEYYKSCNVDILRNDLEINGYLSKDSKTQTQLILIQQNALRLTQIQGLLQRASQFHNDQQQGDIMLRINKNLRTANDEHMGEESEHKENEANLFLGQNYEKQLDYKMC